MKMRRSGRSGPTVSALGLGFVAYSPWGRGLLTGQIRQFEDLAPNDYRRSSPRFQGANFVRNVEFVDRVGQIAAEKNCKPSQLALAWVLAQGADVLPIPGTKRRQYLEQNVAALEVQLLSDDLRRLDEVMPPGIAAGARYPTEGMHAVDKSPHEHHAGSPHCATIHHTGTAA
jgi:aryl-alcohol dehydrogenase-like predicted oxidoreductase